MSTKIKFNRCYFVRATEDGSSSSRNLSAERISDVIDRALTLHKEVWKKFPDMLEIKHKTTG